MKSSNGMADFFFGLSVSLAYFIVVLFLYSKLKVLLVFPVFSGEEDFAAK